MPHRALRSKPTVYKTPCSAAPDAAYAKGNVETATLPRVLHDDANPGPLAARASGRDRPTHGWPHPPVRTIPGTVPWAAPPGAATVVPPRGHSRELLLAGGSVALVLLLLLGIEWLLRWGSPEYLLERPQAALALLHRYSEVYGWEPRPGAVTSIDGQRTTINGRGLRGAEHPPTRTSSRTRVLLLGDSIAFGYGVADDSTFAASMAERGFEVVNLAVPGYGTDQSLLRLEREGMAYAPDIVVLHFCLHNDFVDNASRTYFYDGLHPKPYFTIDRGALVRHQDHLRLSPMDRLGLWMHERSHLFNRLAGRPAPVGQHWTSRKDVALQDAEGAKSPHHPPGGTSGRGRPRWRRRHAAGRPSRPPGVPAGFAVARRLAGGPRPAWNPAGGHGRAVPRT